MRFLRYFGRLVLAFLSPIPLACTMLLFALGDLAFKLFGRRRPPVNIAVSTDAVSVVIPTWNGLDLLQKYLPGVLTALGENPRHEIIVVDNASVDGTAEYLRQHFPNVRVLAQEKNLGFGGGSNAGFRAAKNDVVVLLNNDMRVEPNFLAALLEPFSDPTVFAVACQIFLSDPTKRREETGLTETWWQGGRLVASHHIEPEIQQPFPCAYPGGGSSAFDRRKFLELGGFNEVFRPFYYEDTDLGLVAWKRGWKVLYQPRSIVWHEHRGTIGKKFSRDRIDAAVQRNLVFYSWKNIHDWRMLTGGIPYALVTAIAGSVLARPKGAHTTAAIWTGFGRVFEIMAARWRAHTLACISDREAFNRQKGGYFRDRFQTTEASPARLQVLFVSPYHIEPPTHGGAVFMRETIRALSHHVDVHLLSFVDSESQVAPHDALKPYCASMTILVRNHLSYRMPLGARPRVEIEFSDPDFAWAMHRIILVHKIDVVQIEYSMLSQYVGDYHAIPFFLFEHDVAFQSLGRELAVRLRPSAGFAYMQLMHMELKNAPQFARVQVCSEENKRFLLEFAPALAGRIDSDVRAAIDTGSYEFIETGREPDSVLFVGSFTHQPNVDAMDWVLSGVWPAVLNEHPQAKLYVAGSGNLRILGSKLNQPGVVVLGFVPDIQEVLAGKSMLICPILSGSGVRVKLLEAFASGVPVVSTHLGAEGLARIPGEYCELADTQSDFAAAIVRVLNEPTRAAAMARRARVMVERERDSVVAARKLTQTYWTEVDKRRPNASTSPVENARERAVTVS